MELSTELIAILVTILLGWAGWVSAGLIKNQTAITKLMASDSNLGKAQEDIHHDMTELSKTFKESFSELKEDFRGQMDKVNVRLDIFLKDEISVLKELAKK